MKYTCPFCKQEIVCNHKNKFIAHRRFCKMNPKYLENLKQIRESAKLGGIYGGIKNKESYNKKDPFEEHEFVCEHCHTAFKKTIRHSHFVNGKHPRFCCKKCASIRTYTDETRQKISNSLHKYCDKKYCDCVKVKNNNKNRYVKKQYKKCCVCGNEFLSIDNKMTCSEKCLSILRSTNGQKTYQKLVKENRFKGWRSRKILSYPERFFINVLNNNNIEFQPNFTVKKQDLGLSNDNSCYFLDFLLLKKLDLEIDGSQHKYFNRHESDIRRDELLKNNGYTVYRIEWNEINTDSGKALMKTKIENFLQFYNNYKKEHCCS